MKTLNLDELIVMRHTVKSGGVSYSVRSVTPRIASIIDAANAASGAAKMLGYYDAIAALIPDMPRKEIDALEVPHLLAIIELAGTEVKIVEEAAADPNAQSPASQSSGETDSATS